MNRIFLLGVVLVTSLLTTSFAHAADYVIDTKGAHAAIQFRIKHLGYSWLFGRFNTFEGTFSYDDAKPTMSNVEVTIDTASVDSNHAERDKHLRNEDFLDVKKYPKAMFKSTSIDPTSEGKAVVVGDLTLRGVTKQIAIEVENTGGGKDPWGGYRQGFYGTTKLRLKDFGIPFNLGPQAEEVEMMLSIEGIRQ